MVHTKGKHHKILCNTCHPIFYILIVKDTDGESIYFNCEMGNEYTGPRLFCLHGKFLSLLVLLLSIIVVVLFIFKLKSNIIFHSDNFGLCSLSVCITYEFVVIKCKFVLVVVVLCFEKQKKGKRAKTVSNFNS